MTGRKPWRLPLRQKVKCSNTGRSSLWTVRRHAGAKVHSSVAVQAQKNKRPGGSRDAQCLRQRSGPSSAASQGIWCKQLACQYAKNRLTVKNPRYSSRIVDATELVYDSASIQPAPVRHIALLRSGLIQVDRNCGRRSALAATGVPQAQEVALERSCV